MIATIFMCVGSIMAFCMCSRGLLVLAFQNSTAQKESMTLSILAGRSSGAAKRIARNYAMFAMGALALLSAVGTVKSFLDLFVSF